MDNLENNSQNTESGDNQELKNKEVINDEQVNDVEGEGIDKTKVDDEKQEELESQKTTEQIYEDQIKKMEDIDRQKSGALKESREKIKDLKEQVKVKEENKDEYTDDEDYVQEIKNLKTQITDIENTVVKNSEEALRIAQETKIEAKISSEAENSGEEKLIKFFYDKKTSKELPLDERVKQATILARGTLAEDVEFQNDIKKANDSSVRISGIKNKETSDIPSDAMEFAKTVLKTDKGLAEFKKSYRKK